MKKKYGHNLLKLWQRFKTAQANPVKLAPFDATIHALHKFEDLRYPDKISHPAVFLALTWKPSHAATQYAGRPTQKYEVFISDVDRLVVEILKRMSLNPKVFIRMIRRSGRGALRYQNPHASRWLRP